MNTEPTTKEPASAPGACYSGWSVVFRSWEPVAAFPQRRMAEEWIKEAPHRVGDIIKLGWELNLYNAAFRRAYNRRIRLKHNKQST